MLDEYKPLDLHVVYLHKSLESYSNDISRDMPLACPEARTRLSFARLLRAAAAAFSAALERGGADGAGKLLGWRLHTKLRQ